MEKVLVTGATGFIGGYVIRELLRHGVHVIATSSNKEKAASQDWFTQVDYRPLDLSNLDTAVDYFTFFDRPDRMIHLAWEGLPDYRNDRHLTEYLPRHAAFLRNLIQHGLRNLTVTGTCLEYGMVNGRLSEDQDCHPTLPYPSAKNQLRILLEEWTRETQLSFKWIRLFYMYGKGQNPKSLFSQLESAVRERHPVFNMSPGDQERDFLPVEDVAAYIALIARQDRVRGIINCCSGQPVSVKKWVEDFIKANWSGIKLNPGYYPYPDYEPMSFWGDNKKLLSIIAS